MRYWIVIAFSSLLAACGLKKSLSSAPAELIPVEIFVSVHQPYCGGAAPTPEMERGQFLPVQNELFVLKKGLVNRPEIPIYKELKTDDSGRCEVQVPAGNYVMIHASKLRSFDDFKSLHQPKSSYVEYLGDDCLRRAYEAPDFILRIQRDTTIRLTQKSACHTGTSPCVRYTGPQAP